MSAAPSLTDARVSEREAEVAALVSEHLTHQQIAGRLHRSVRTVRRSGLEGTGEIWQRDLVMESLRMRPSRMIVGEVRAEECLGLLLALNAGLPGMCTLHTNSARGPGGDVDAATARLASDSDSWRQSMTVDFMGSRPVGVTTAGALPATLAT